MLPPLLLFSLVLLSVVECQFYGANTTFFFDNQIIGNKFGSTFAYEGLHLMIGAPISDNGAVFYYLQTGGSWTFTQQIQSPDPSSNDFFGASISISNNYAVIGAYGNSTTTGAAYLFIRSGTKWNFQTKILADDGLAGDNFGVQVSISGNRILIGTKNSGVYHFTYDGVNCIQNSRIGQNITASGKNIAFASNGTTLAICQSGDSLNNISGVCQIFSLIGNSWNLQQQLIGSSSTFGFSVAIDSSSNSQKVLVVGSPEESLVYLFSYVASSWTETQKLNGSDTLSSDSFGASVSIYQNKVLVGSPKADVGSNVDQGALYLFTLSGGIWRETKKVVLPNALAFGLFPEMAQISSSFIVASTSYADQPPLWDSGLLVLFDSTTFNLVSSISNPLYPTNVTFRNQGFGSSVFISGKDVVVGSPFAYPNGQVTVFSVDWNSFPQAILLPHESDSTSFGNSVGISGDWIAVGASSTTLLFLRTNGKWNYFQTIPLSGSILLTELYLVIGNNVFVPDQLSWKLQQVLNGTDENPSGFGSAVSLSGDTLAIGAYNAIVNGVFGRGAVYVFVTNGVTWTQQQKLFSVSVGPNGFFGFSVAISGNVLVASAPLDFPAKVFLYSRSGSVWSLVQTLVDPFGGSYFGNMLAISATQLFIGAQNYEVNGGLLIYDLSNLTQPLQILTPNPPFNANFGRSFGVSQVNGFPVVVVGAPNYNDSGRVFAFATNEAVFQAVTTAQLVLTTNPSILSTGEVVGKRSSSSKNTGNGLIIGIVVGVAGFLLLLLLGILLFVFLSRRNKKQKREKTSNVEMKEKSPTTVQQQQEEKIETGKEETKVVTSEASLKVKKSNVHDLTQLSDVEIEKQIGAGNFGEVFKGTWIGVPVALKKLKNTELMAEFEREAVRLGSLNHPHVVRFFGIYKFENLFYMVTEFVSKGCFLDVIVEEEFDTPILLDCILQVCSGLDYLKRQNIIHRDLALRNVLVTIEDTRHIVKVSDLGMSTTINYYSENANSIAVRWAAPEVFSRLKFSFQSDVWALGILIWEIFSEGDKPYGKKTNSEVMEFVMAGGKLDKPDRCPEELYSLMLQMWNLTPNERPEINQIQTSISEIAKKH